MLMMLLCACRSRLTNNTEVTSTIADEDGYLSSEYQMRRDMIGEPVAERPIFTGWGSDDSNEDYYDPGTDAFDNYDQGTLDEWDEPEDVTSSPSSSSGSSSSGGSSSSSSGGSSGSSRTRGDNKKTDDDEDYIMVSFDPNGGTSDIAAIPAKKGDVYGQHGDFPSKVEYADHSFEGWFTEKDGGTQITEMDKVSTDKDHTLYAHWKEVKKKDFDLVFKLDDGVIDGKKDDVPVHITDGLYPQIKTPVKTGFHFMGWYLEDGTTKIEPGQECSANHTITAHWLENAKYWEKVYNDTNPAEENKLLFITDDNDTGKLVRGNPLDESATPDLAPAFIIIRLTDDTYTPEAAKEVAAQKRAASEKYKDSKIVVIPKSSTDGSNELYYKLILQNAMYGGIDGIDSAAAETGATISDYAVDPDKAAPAQ